MSQEDCFQDFVLQGLGFTLFTLLMVGYNEANTPSGIYI